MEGSYITFKVQLENAGTECVKEHGSGGSARPRPGSRQDTWTQWTSRCPRVPVLVPGGREDAW